MPFRTGAAGSTTANSSPARSARSNGLLARLVPRIRAACRVYLRPRLRRRRRAGRGDLPPVRPRDRPRTPPRRPVVIEVEAIPAQGARILVEAQHVHHFVRPAGGARPLLHAQEDAVLLGDRVVALVD